MTTDADYIVPPGTNQELRHSKFACRPPRHSPFVCQNGWLPAESEQVGALWRCSDCLRYWFCVWTEGAAFWRPVSDRRARRIIRNNKPHNGPETAA